ncbi:DUF4304 domain-containing protein [uncultured Metabacillus sp.]|uniref:DUF4304 domain-containing protein n=1 Tax=uncultured Metabacillus sp. TaxID=2860135 RepID=UPI00345ADFEE
MYFKKLHFRRKNEENINLITFQFNKWGGSFVVELASCCIGENISYPAKLLPTI